MRQSRTRFTAESLESRRLLAVDLAASLSVSATGYQAGDTVTGNFTLQNLGNSTVTPTFQINFRLSTDTTYGNGDDLGSVTIPVTNDIPPGTFPVPIQFQLPIPVNTPAGEYYVIGKVDSGSAVSESNENNNVFYTANLLGIVSSSGLLVASGTSGADGVTIGKSGSNVSIKIGAAAAKIYSGVSSVLFHGLGGNDSIIVGNGLSNVTINGGDGDDYIVDGDGANTLYGNAGKDKLYGGLGNDALRGNGGNDKLFGEGGLDRLYGYDGTDTLDGGSSRDRFYPGGQNDICYGQSGDDIFFNAGLGADQLFGGSGNDSRDVDPSDTASSVELFNA